MGRVAIWFSIGNTFREIEVYVNKLLKGTEFTLESDKHFRFILISVSTFWYLALFPGRLGFDYSEAIRIMQRGESTDWWTASYWWFLQITSFNGNSIYLSSLLSLAVFGYSIYTLSESIPLAKRYTRRSSLILFATPIYGAFGLTVSHDVFQVSGIILFTAYQVRVYSASLKSTRFEVSLLLLAACLVLTTQYGIFLIAMNSLLLLFQKRIRVAFGLLIFSVTYLVVTSIGVTSVPTYGAVLPILGDIKCVAQHPEAEISADEWGQLVAFAPRDEWLVPATCSIVDEQFKVMPSLELAKVKVNVELIKLYASIAHKNSAIVAMAHFQRASVALPPPFFSGPVNQVELNPSIPIGQGTNTALQSNAEVLHPSVDEPSVDINVKAFQVLEIPAQGLIFIVNQASWFWGWGGLWLWPFTLFIILFLKRRFRRSTIPIFANTLVLHSLLLILAAPLPRYVMSTIVLGFYFSIVIALIGYEVVMNGNRKP